MLSADVQELNLPPTHLVGFSIKASLNEIIDQKLGNRLRSQLVERAGEIEHAADGGVYLAQAYDPVPWTRDTPFTQVIGRAVTHQATTIPSGMVTHTIPGGTYLKFVHRGPMRGIGASYDEMHAWLAKNDRSGPCPYDFEYWHDAERLEESDTEIAIHFPQLRGR